MTRVKHVTKKNCFYGNQMPVLVGMFYLTFIYDIN